MECMVCGQAMTYYFTKEFQNYGLDHVDYVKCGHCGFVMSETHKKMSHDAWMNLNHEYHSGYLGDVENHDDPKWMMRLAAQKTIISQLVESGLLEKGAPWVDYGCGDGKLADWLTEVDLLTQKYDRYMDNSQNDYLTREELLRQKFGLVINTSVFEHVLELRDLEEIVGLVEEDGVFALHTLVMEEIPQDPNWFYLLPVHVAFFSNQSMNLLFHKWGFQSSLYHPESRMWFWFKKERPDMRATVERLNEQQESKIFYKSGFMDYWK